MRSGSAEDEELPVCPVITAVHQRFPEALVSMDTLACSVAQGRR